MRAHVPPALDFQQRPSELGKLCPTGTLQLIYMLTFGQVATPFSFVTDRSKCNRRQFPLFWGLCMLRARLRFLVWPRFAVLLANGKARRD